MVEWRLPRVLLALMIGAALGLSGAIFQALTRNPLGSPDIIGFNTGAYTGVLVVTVFVGNGYYLRPRVRWSAGWSPRSSSTCSPSSAGCRASG